MLIVDYLSSQLLSLGHLLEETCGAARQTQSLRNHHAWIHTVDLSPPSFAALPLPQLLVWLLSPYSFIFPVPFLSGSQLIVLPILHLLLSSYAQEP